jgi:hypothetical protein
MDMYLCKRPPEQTLALTITTFHTSDTSSEVHLIFHLILFRIQHLIKQFIKHSGDSLSP